MNARTPLRSALEEESHQWCCQVSGTIIRVRKERGWSQQQLANKVGLSQRQVCEIETKPDKLHLGRVHGTLRALGLQLSVQPIEPEPRRRRRANDQ